MEDATANDLQDQLESLRPELLVDRGRPFLDLFDEFMRQREFGLALHGGVQTLNQVNARFIDSRRVLIKNEIAHGMESQA